MANYSYEEIKKYADIVTVGEAILKAAAIAGFVAIIVHILKTS